jgi:formylglycine-generating enzyme required for sulfatase activity/serine/threonine protein kinase
MPTVRRAFLLERKLTAAPNNSVAVPADDKFSTSAAKMHHDLPALPRGKMLFEYRIDAVLGSGGFGITYLAQDTLLNEPVAIKEYFPAQIAIRTDDHSARAGSQKNSDAFKEGVDAFLTEARIIARCRHPNITRVRRFFEARGTGYIVFDFVHGRSLEEAMVAGPLPEDQTLIILDGILKGLKQVHDLAVLHRDLKPRNIILRHDGSPVLIDFGAARDFGTRDSTTVTQIVSPGYSSPEQYGVGEQQGPWSDLYSVGAILYRAVTGTPPIDSLRRLIDDPLEPASKLAAGRYDAALLNLIDRLMSIEPTQRPASTDDVGRLLTLDAEAATKPEGDGADRVKTVNKYSTIRWRRGVALAGILLVAFMGIATVSRLTAFRRTTQGADVGAAAPARPLGPVANEGSKHRTKPTAGMRFQDCTNCPVMMVMASGSFSMGSTDVLSEQPVHRVTIAAPFAIGEREVTFREWNACATAGGCTYRPDDQPGHDDYPVTNLSWLDAQEYVTWLSKTTGKAYRLPSEAEWEYAARGNVTTSFWWGDAVGTDRANCTGCGSSAKPATIAVGSFAPNPFGLFDTAGNAAEWVEDCWTPNYDGAPTDGRAATSAICRQHVLRGGAFNNGGRYLRSASRSRYDTAVRYYANGLRVASEVGRF